MTTLVVLSMVGGGVTVAAPATAPDSSSPSPSRESAAPDGVTRLAGAVPPSAGATALARGRGGVQSGAPGFEVTGGTVRPGENLTLTVTFRNDDTPTDEVAFQLPFEAPLDRDGWEILRYGAPDGGEWATDDRFFRARELDPGAVVNATVTLRPPEDAAPGTYTIELERATYTTDGEVADAAPETTVTLAPEPCPDGGSEDSESDPASVSRVAFVYGEYGGTVNLGVNDALRNVDSFAALDGTTVGGAAVTVTSTGPDTGTVELAGTVRTFCVGGQELWIDNVTFGPPGDPRATVGFDRLSPARSEYDVGETFTAFPSNVSARVGPFRFSDGSRYREGSVAPSAPTPPLSGGAGRDFATRSATLGFDIGSVGEGRDEDSFVVPVDPTRTYLHVADDDAGRPEPIDLAARGIDPGERLRLTRVGEFEDGTAGRGLLAVFSTNATLLEGARRARVPGAVDAGTDHVTARTFNGDEPTDVPEDFLVADNAGRRTSTSVAVPPDARYLFVAAKDNLYEDNADPDGDFAVRITARNGSSDEVDPELGSRSPAAATRKLTALLRADRLTPDEAADLLDELPPERSGAILEYMLTHGQPIRSAELLDRMDERRATAALDATPEYRRIVTNPEFQRMREGMYRRDLVRLAVEQEEGEFFDPAEPDVTFRNASEPADLTVPPLNGSATAGSGPASRPSTEPGRGYDAKVR